MSKKSNNLNYIFLAFFIYFYSKNKKNKETPTDVSTERNKLPVDIKTEPLIKDGCITDNLPDYPIKRNPRPLKENVIVNREKFERLNDDSYNGKKIIQPISIPKKVIIKRPIDPHKYIKGTKKSLPKKSGFQVPIENSYINHIN
jgi:hypothetical protein